MRVDCLEPAYHKNPILSREEELQLVHKMKHSPDVEEQQAARHQLVTSCIPWATKLAQPFFNSGLERDDIVQQALLGLIRSVDKFEPEKYGTRLVTYCVMAVRRFILREIFHTSSIVTIPYNRDTNNAELIQRAQAVTRLDAYETNDQISDSSLQAKTEEETPYENWRWLLQKYWNVLNDRQQQILQMRMSGQTLQDVGKIFNISRERVSQIQDRAVALIQQAVRAAEHEESRA
jgi:RNA polymerase sigma factor (sigma-70 family)